jgi:hypothetical protein
MTSSPGTSGFVAIRSGRYADAATALGWLGAAAATVAHPAGLVVAGLLLAIVAPSRSRAFASAASFGIVVAAAVTTWIVVVGTWPITVGMWPATAGMWPGIVLAPVQAVLLALVAPPIVATLVRALG